MSATSSEGINARSLSPIGIRRKWQAALEAVLEATVEVAVEAALRMALRVALREALRVALGAALDAAIGRFLCLERRDMMLIRQVQLPSVGIA